MIIFSSRQANSSSSSSSSSGSSSSNSEPNLSLEGIYPESDDDSDKENLEQLEEEMDDFVQTVSNKNLAWLLDIDAVSSI